MGAFHFVFDRVANILYEEIEKEQEVWRACKAILYSLGVITIPLIYQVLDKNLSQTAKITVSL